MLTVYSVSWCPHCKQTTRWLMENHIDFKYIDVEHQSAEVLKPVIDANGGKDWVVPTLEFKGKWRRGKRFDAEELKSDLHEMGVL